MERKSKWGDSLALEEIAAVSRFHTFVQDKVVLCHIWAIDIKNIMVFGKWLEELPDLEIPRSIDRNQKKKKERKTKQKSK